MQRCGNYKLDFSYTYVLANAVFEVVETINQIID